MTQHEPFRHHAGATYAQGKRRIPAVRRGGTALIFTIVSSATAFAHTVPIPNMPDRHSMDLYFGIALAALLAIAAGIAMQQRLHLRRLQQELVAVRQLMAYTKPVPRVTSDGIRRLQRFYFDKPAKMTFVAEGGKQTTFGRLCDISEGGVGIVVTMPISVGEPVELEIGFSHDLQMHTTGVVRHRRGVHHGLEFNQLSAGALQEIRSVCSAAIPVADVVHAEELVGISSVKEWRG